MIFLNVLLTIMTKVGRFIVKNIHIFLILLAALFLLYSVSEKFFGSKTSFDIHHIEVNLQSIKEIGDLHISRQIIAHRVQLVFNNDEIIYKSSITDNKYISLTAIGLSGIYGYLGLKIYDWISDSGGAIDYIAICQVDAKIPLSNVQYAVDQKKGTVHVTLPEIIIETGLTDTNNSFIWDEQGKLPSNALPRATYEAENQVVTIAEKRNICSEAYESAESFFRLFFESLGFSEVTFTKHSACINNIEGQSLSSFTNDVLSLCRKTQKEFPENVWHVDPHMPEGKSKYACDNFEGLNNGDYLLLFYDTHKKKNGHTGLVLSSKGLHWENGYWRSSNDTKKNFLTWDEFRNVWITAHNTLVVFGALEESPENFIDVNNDNDAVNMATFLLVLQQISRTDISAENEVPRTPSLNNDTSVNNENALVTSCINNLQQLGLIVKMYSNESAGEMAPALSSRSGGLMFEKDDIYPEYMVGETILVCPAETEKQQQIGALKDYDKKVTYSTENSSYWYLGYAIPDEETGLAFVEAYKKQAATGNGFETDLLDASGNKILRLREGIEKLVNTEGMDTSKSIPAQLPIIIERPGHHPGKINVIFVDGHAETLDYPSEYPASKTFIESLQSLDN